MKKIFTLLTMVLMAVGASAQVISWNAEQAKDETNKPFNGKAYGEGFVLTLTDTKGKMAIDANDAFFGTAESPIKFTHRLKTGGKSDASNNNMKLTIPSKGTLKVYVRTGSNSATDRNLVLKQNDETLYDEVILESNAVKVIMEDRIDPEKNPTGETNVYPIIEVSVVAGTVEVGYPTNSLNFYGFEFISSGESDTPQDPTAATTWNFTAELSSADADNLAADATNWKWDDENGYWTNNAVLTARNEFTALKANGADLEISAGLTFTRDNNSGLDAGRIRIAPAKFLAINGSAVVVNFGSLVKDDVIKMRFKGAGDSERTMNFTNAEVTEGSLATADTDIHEATLKVSADGVVKFATTNGFQYMAITINTELPEYTPATGISVINAETKTATDGAIYNLSGQRVDENYRGVVIINGKKVVIK